jgi:hypothetical protein
VADARRRASSGLALALVIALWSFAPSAAEGAVSPAAAAAAKALAQYHALMIALQKPANMVFMYSETRTGPTRIVSGVHRVYRDKDGNQRNDTIAIDDSPVRPPETQTFVRAIWPYFPDQFDVPASDYDVTSAGTAFVNGHKAFLYRTNRLSPAAFAITELAVEPGTGIPLRELFAVSTRDCDGTGQIEFTQIGSYLLPSSVAAQCTEGSDQFKHVIKFSDYSFPAAIPQEVLHPAGASAG